MGLDLFVCKCGDPATMHARNYCKYSGEECMGYYEDKFNLTDKDLTKILGNYYNFNIAYCSKRCVTMFCKCPIHKVEQIREQIIQNKKTLKETKKLAKELQRMFDTVPKNKRADSSEDESDVESDS